MTDSLTLFRQFTAPKADDLIEAWGDVVPYEPLWGAPGNSDFGSNLVRYQRPATTIWDRSDGRYLPIYQDEFDLAVIRAMGRTLSEVAPGLVGGIRNMCNYTIGKGFTFTAVKEHTAPISDETLAPVLNAVQREIDTLLDDIKFTSRFDREIFSCSIKDGESFLQLRPCHGGKVKVVRREPDEFRQPLNTRQLEDWIEDAYGIPCSEFVSSWSFGVHTRADDTADVLGYHRVTDESGSDWEYIPASRMVHIKRNVTRNAKRGFSDLFPVEADSTRGEKLRRNMAEGAAVQSSIAFVRQHVAGATVAGVQTMLGTNKTGTVQQSTQTGNRTTNVTRYNPGTVVDISAGLEYKPGPMGSERAEHFLLVANYVMRMQAARWCMPEYMFSADASNANMASTFAATDPFVKSCEFEQGESSAYDLELLWKALRIRWEMGAFAQFGISWEELQCWIKINCECPEVATRDELKNVQRDMLLVQAGAMSPKTLASRHDLDYEAEVASGAMPVGGAVPMVTSATTDANTLVDPLTAGGAPVDVASTAMNGAQVSSLVDFIAQVAAGTLPAESAIQAIALAFPTVSLDQARAMINPAAAQSGVAQPVLNPDGTPQVARATQGGGELVGMKLRDVSNIDKLRTRYLDAFKAGEADEKTTRLALDGLGYSKDKIDLYLDADPANDPPSDAAEEVTEAIDATAEKLPASDVPKRVPTNAEIVANAEKTLDKLYDQLTEAMLSKAPQSKLKAILEQIETVTAQARHAAEICGYLTPFKPTLNDAESAKDAPVKQQAAVVTDPKE